MKALYGLGMRLVLGLILAFSISGCGKKGTEAAKRDENVPLPEPPMVANCEPGVQGGRLAVAQLSDPKTFNPLTQNEQSSEAIVQFLFSALLRLDWASQEVEPGLAEKWTVEPDNKTWTFTLRKGLKWSDGQPLTADDVIFTFNDVIYNTNIINVVVDALRIDKKDAQVTKVDDLTIKIVTPEPYAPFLEIFGTGVPIVPKHILAKAVAEKRYEAAYGINTPPKDLVGCGPYKLKTFKPGEITILEPNPYYHVVDKNGKRLPYLDNLIYTVAPDMNAIALRFLKGESDALEQLRPDEYIRFKEASEGGKKFTMHELGMGLERVFVWFNLNTNMNAQTGKPLVDPKKLKWFRDKRFRQAISHAIDRDSIVKSVYAGRAEPNYGFITKANKKWFNPNIKQYPFDVERAKALLKEIGIQDRNGDGFLEDADGTPIEFVLNTNTGNNIRERMSILIQEDLKRLGIKLIFQPMDFNTLVSKIDTSYDYECILLSLGGGSVDPAGSMNVLKSDGFTHQWFPRQKSPATPWEARIDELMNQQIKTLDFAKRKQLFDEVQAILSEELPMIYTASPNSYAVSKPGIGNLRPTVFSYYRVTWNAEELYFKK